jgi:hypothetical protein
MWPKIESSSEIIPMALCWATEVSASASSSTSACPSLSCLWEEKAEEHGTGVEVNTKRVGYPSLTKYPSCRRRVLLRSICRKQKDNKKTRGEKNTLRGKEDQSLRQRERAEEESEEELGEAAEEGEEESENLKNKHNRREKGS